jgi:hypothetical protein
MQAWNWTAVVLLAIACGGTESTDDGGLGDGGNTNDGTTLVDSGTNDGSILGDSAPPDDGGPVIDEGPPDSTGPFDPSQLGTNLVLWLDAAKGVTQNNNAVSVWADQTSYHNDASGGSGNGAHQPTVNATAINSLPAMEFAIPQNANAASQYFDITDSASLEFGTGDFAIFMVGEYDNPTANSQNVQATFYDKVAGNTVPSGPQLYGNGPGPNNGTVAVVRARLNATDNVDSTAANYNDGKYHRIGIRRTGTTLQVWTDGTSAAFAPDAGGNVDVSASGSDATIGATIANNFPGTRLSGGIAEVVGVKGSLSDGDATNLDGYFKAKYNLQ